MKKYFLPVSLLTICRTAWSCPACGLQQPKLLRGITHGTGPQHPWDMPIVWITVVIVLLTLLFSIKWLIHPGEREEGHIKRMILNGE